MTPGSITSYAQNFEDVILWRAFGKLGGGFYIDIGAQDPVVDSVSLGFYEQGWRGIHVEPNAHYADLLRRHRSDESVIQAAVSDKPELLSFFEVADSGMSTLVSDMAEELVRRGWAVSKTIVPAVTLDQVFGSVPQGQDVHWLKIDAEGAEAAILSGWQDQAIRPAVILLEAIDPFDQSPNHESWEPTLVAKGYHFVYFDGINRFYVADEHAALDQHFRFGASVWDNFTLPESSRLIGAAFQASKAQRQKLEGDVDQLREQLSRQDADLDRSKSEFETLRAEYEAEKHDLAQARAEVSRLNSQNTRLRHQAEETVRLRVGVEQAQRLLAQLDADIRADALASAEGAAPDDLMAPAALASSAQVRLVDDIMSLPDEAFVRKSYEIVLGREADPVGLAYYFRMLSEGQSRLSVLKQLRRSPEGRGRPPGLIDLDQKLAELPGKLASLKTWLRHRVGGAAEGYDVANEVEAISQQIERLTDLADVQRKIAGRIAQLLQRLGSLSASWDANSEPVSFQSEEAPPAITVRRLAASAESARIEVALNNALDRLGAVRDQKGVTVVVAEPAAPIDSIEGPALLIGPDWVETGFPVDWADRLNNQFAGVGCTSRHARKILIDHGVSVPTEAVGLGLEDLAFVASGPPPDLGEKKFRFVHVAKSLTEDGTDLALRAFGRVFRGHADVSLVIACEPELQAGIEAELDALRSKQDNLYPHVIVLPGAWAPSELASLFAACDVLLAPARAMPFSSPVALAVSARLPVIATRWGGHMDYCSQSSAWLVDYDFERAHSERNLVSSAWARPRDASLDDALRAARNASPQDLMARLDQARRSLMEHFSWDAAARRTLDMGRRISFERPHRAPRVGWVTTWNVECGIASAAANLLETLSSENVVVYGGNQSSRRLREDADNCHRLWHVGKSNNNLAAVLDHMERSPIDALVIHFNHGFYDHDELSTFIESAVGRGIVVVMDLHSTVDPGDDPNVKLSGLIDGLRKCHRLLAHGTHDMNRLKALGLVDNVMLFPLGVIPRAGQRNKPSEAAVPMIASFGFCLPGKGLVELVEAVAILRDRGRALRMLMLNARYPVPQSQHEIERIREKIEQLDLEGQVDFRTEYLPEAECLALLGKADLVVNPYQSTGEAASASARLSLASGSPLLVTPISIFDDLQNAVFRTPGASAINIADGIATALDHIKHNTAHFRAVNTASDEWLNVHDFGRQGAKLMNMISALRDG